MIKVKDKIVTFTGKDLKNLQALAKFLNKSEQAAFTQAMKAFMKADKIKGVSK